MRKIRVEYEVEARNKICGEWMWFCEGPPITGMPFTSLSKARAWERRVQDIQLRKTRIIKRTYIAEVVK